MITARDLVVNWSDRRSANSFDHRCPSSEAASEKGEAPSEGLPQPEESLVEPAEDCSGVACAESPTTQPRPSVRLRNISLCFEDLTDLQQPLALKTLAG
jgi:hypothetical protein